MWINEVAPERVADLFDNYRQALTVCGKGSESASGNGMPPSEENLSSRPTAQEFDPTQREVAKLRQYFAEPGEANWGC